MGKDWKVLWAWLDIDKLRKMSDEYCHSLDENLRSAIPEIDFKMVINISAKDNFEYNQWCFNDVVGEVYDSWEFVNDDDDKDEDEQKLAWPPQFLYV